MICWNFTSYNLDVLLQVTFSVSKWIFMIHMSGVIGHQLIMLPNVISNFVKYFVAQAYI